MLIGFYLTDSFVIHSVKDFKMCLKSEHSDKKTLISLSSFEGSMTVPLKKLIEGEKPQNELKPTASIFLKF
jgi:hypothetical protein